MFWGGRKDLKILKYGTDLPSGFLHYYYFFFLWKTIIQSPILLKLFAIIFVLLKLSSFYHVFGRLGFY